MTVSRNRDMIERMRIDFRYHAFHGKAVAQEESIYIAQSGKQINLAPLDEIGFRSEFKEISFTFPLARNLNRRIGLYHSVARKPHETTLTAANIVLETDITGTGIKFIYQSEEFLSDMNLGAVEFAAKQRNFHSRGFDFMYHGEWRPRFYLIGDKQSYQAHNRSTFVLVPSFGWQFNFQLGGQPDAANDQTGELSMDIILDIGIHMEYQFY
jgi:hypothetical protein